MSLQLHIIMHLNWAGTDDVDINFVIDAMQMQYGNIRKYLHWLRTYVQHFVRHTAKKKKK